MFTGLVQAVTKVSAVQHGGAASLLQLRLPELAAQVCVGDSVMIDGACLTAVALKGELVDFDVSSETLRLTTLGALRRGDRVNVELAMRPTDRFGGHFVSGHVDGQGTITRKDELPGETRLAVRVSRELVGMMVVKGSVAVDGVSLTIAALSEDGFEASLIPHTLEATTLASKGPGAAVNVECDMLGKWVMKLMGAEGRAQAGGGSLTLDRLREEGY